MKPALLCAVVIANAGCVDVVEVTPPTPPSPPPAQTAPAREVEPSHPALVVGSYDPIKNGSPRRDPFKSYFSSLDDESDVVACFGGPLSSLQRVDLDKLKLTSVVVGQAVPMAQVEGPDGVGHTLKVGSLIGRHLGQVTAIRRGVVVINEETRDFTGRRIPHRVELKLASP